MQAQIDPAIYDAILNMGGQTAQMDPQIAQAQQMAKILRANGQAPQLIDAGRRVVAPSKMAYLGALANQAVAGSREQQAVGLQQQQAALRQQQVQQVLQALRQNQGGQQQQPPTEMPYQLPGTPQAGV